MRLTRVHFILIVVVLVFTCLNYIPMSEHLLGSPWADQYYHIALAEHIKVYNNSAYGCISQYHYAPLYHVLLVSLSSISGVEIIYVACFLNFLVPALLAISAYLIAIRVFKEKMIGILSVVVLLTSMILTRPQLDPRQLSTVFFLLTMVILLMFYTKKKLSRLDYSFLPIALLLLMLSHPEAFVRHLVVILPMIALLYLWYEREGHAFVQGRTKKLLTLVGGFLILPVLIVLKDSFLISKIFIPYFTSSSCHSWTMLEATYAVTPFVIVLSAVGLLFVILQRKENRLVAAFLLSWISITLLLVFTPIGPFLYREVFFLVFPLSISAGFGIYQGVITLLSNRRTRNAIFSVLLIAFMLASAVEMSRGVVENNGNFVDSVVWAKNNLNNGKVLGYHRMMWGFQTIFVGSELEPALPFSRTISILENNPVYIEVMREGNPADAMRRENIGYIITTTYENYQRFMNDNFKLIYEVEWPGVENRRLRIFELLRMGTTGGDEYVRL